MFQCEEIKSRLKETVRELARLAPSKDIYLILVGSAVLIVRYDLKRATQDMDVMLPSPLMGVGGFLQSRGFQVVSEALLSLHPDYLDRVESLYQSGRVRLMCLGPYDVAVAKIGRGLDHDIADLFESKVLQALDVARLEELYRESMDFWIGDKKRFEANWERFMDEYERKATSRNRNRASSPKGKGPVFRP